MTREQVTEAIIHAITADQKLAVIDAVFDEFVNKYCDSCKHKPEEGEDYPMDCGTCSRFYGDKFEEKKDV